MPPAAIEIKPQEGPQTAFLSSSADVVFFGGAAGGGKTYGEFLESLRHTGNSQFRALMLRRIKKEILNPGGLWDESLELFPAIGATPVASKLLWMFPSGAVLKFDSIQFEHSVKQWQGSQIPLILFDEVTHFTERQFFYMLSRNRSTCGVRPYVRATCNPDAESWVATFIAWWIDQDTGFAIPERSGVVRWFVRIDGEIHWADTREELLEKFSHLPPEDVKPKSFTFIVSKLEDNKILMQKDPGYRANLLAMPYVDRMRLLNGNWKVKFHDGAIWPDQHWADLYSAEWPSSFDLSAMAIDPSKGGPKSDYAAIVFVGVSGDCLFADAIVSRMEPDRLAEAVVDMYAEHRPSIVGLEDNMLQDVAFMPLFNRETERRRLPPMPLIGINNTVRKEHRIKSLTPHVTNKSFRFRKSSAGCDRLESQMRAFPNKDVHDDGPDALEMAIRLLWKYVEDETDQSGALVP